VWGFLPADRLESSSIHQRHQAFIELREQQLVGHIGGEMAAGEAQFVAALFILNPRG